MKPKKPMANPDAASAVPEKEPAAERHRLKLIRFASREDCRRAIGVLLERGMLNYSSSVNEWGLRTEVVRALRDSAAPFAWLTENA